jgi:hypothetical protein
MSKPKHQSIVALSQNNGPIGMLRAIPNPLLKAADKSGNPWEFLLRKVDRKSLDGLPHNHKRVMLCGILRAGLSQHGANYRLVEIAAGLGSIKSSPLLELANSFKEGDAFYSEAKKIFRKYIRYVEFRDLNNDAMKALFRMACERNDFRFLKSIGRLLDEEKPRRYPKGVKDVRGYFAENDPYAYNLVTHWLVGPMGAPGFAFFSWGAIERFLAFLYPGFEHDKAYAVCRGLGLELSGIVDVEGCEIDKTTNVVLLKFSRTFMSLRS